MKGPDARYAVGVSNVNTRAIKVLCPYHDDSDPSMAVFADGTKCFACGAEESVEVFCERMGVEPDELPVVDYTEYKKSRGSSRTYIPQPSTLTQVDVYHDLIMDEESPRHYKLQWYLDRGLFRHTIKKRKLGHSGTLFTIPVWYGDEITGMKFRRDEEFHSPDDMKRSKYFPPAGQPILLYRPTPHVGMPFITEGELDALALSQYGFDAITTTGGAETLHSYLTPERLRLSSPVVAVDMDSAGQLAYDKLCTAWGEPLRRLMMPEGMDVTNWLLSIDVVNKQEYIKNYLEGGADD